jgi:two-component system sensor histidine kinase DctS
MQTELFHSAFKFSPIGISLVSPDGKWLKVNDALLNLLGYSEDEFLTKDFIEMTHPEDLKTDLAFVNELILGQRESYQMEKRYIHKDGSLVFALLSVSLIRNADFSPRFFISQIQDLSDLKKAQAELHNNSKMVALGEMAAGIAHEINNPLTIINLHSKALEQLIGEEELNRPLITTFTAKITDTVKRISSIVSSLRKFSTDNSKMVSFESYYIADIIQDSLGLCTEKFKSAGVSLELSVPRDLEVECNPLDISQVLINLINNAFYAIKNEEVKKISISVQEVEGVMVMSVMDSGPQIPAAIRGKLLDPFFTTKPIGQGTGLGLSISRSLINVHQGELYLDESSEKTNFVVKIPVQQYPANRFSTLGTLTS